LRKLNLDNINLKEAVLTGCNFSEGSLMLTLEVQIYMAAPYLVPI
jgi:uncharacterized protein YjbI with pentapeptide repeats